MSYTPEALRLADTLENRAAYLQPWIDDGLYTDFGYYPEGMKKEQAKFREISAELRRLHAVNADLLEALKVAMGHIEMNKLKISHCKDEAMIRAAISRTEGASHE